MALELVGGAFLDAIFNVLLGRIASPEVVSFFKKNKQSDKFLKKLKIALLSVNSVLNDAEEKQMGNAVVKQWLDELDDVAFDADDLLDEICPHAITGADEVQTLGSIPMNLYDKGIERELEDILERLEFIIKQKDVLHLKVGRGLRIPQSTPTSSVIEACDVYGRDCDKKALVKLLSDDSNNDHVGVIPVVGMGGIGKTTLAQFVYNDDRVQKEFDIKAWIYVSGNFDICKITKTLLEVVTSRSWDTEDLNSLQRNLKMCLTNKKFLFVFDDVWNENYDNWDKLRSQFKHGVGQGSKIIVTTRSAHVASIMQTVPVYNLSKLSDKDSWVLFAGHVFPHKNSVTDPVLENIGRRIVKRCQGLPLAVKTLAGLLRSKCDSREWYKVHDSEIWDLQDHESNILPALRLSYLFLPSHLRRCFAYCSIFPKDFEFRKDELILLWMAEGLLQQLKRHKRIEDVGDEYFCELVSRSFFQQCSRRDRSCFVMHHLVTDLAQFVSGTHSVRLEGRKCNEVEERTRHLSHIIEHRSSCINWESVGKASRLRTFLQISLVDRSISSKIPDVLLMNLRYLRVLSLVALYCSRLPDSIGELRHLRYLDVSGTKIYNLPQSICNLCNLQTLKLVGCSSLEQLPMAMHKLFNLRYLDIRGTCLKWMPLQLSELRNLQNLSDFFVGEQCGCSMVELRELNLHGSLFIHNVTFANLEDSEGAMLKQNENLEKLSLDWGGSGDTDDSQHEKNVLDCLRPHSNLKELAIYKYPGTEFSKWLGDYAFSNLVSLELKCCKYCYILPPLGQLFSLKELCIAKFDGLVNVGYEFYGNGTFSCSAATEKFPALEVLRFECMLAWERWCPVGNGVAFPRLRELHIESCPRLTGDLPGNLQSLTLLIIRNCNQLRCLPPKASAMRTLNIQNSRSLKLPVHAMLLTSLYLHSSCNSLKLLSLDLFPNLIHLDIAHCESLEALGVSVSMALRPSLSSLHSLCITSCPKFVSFSLGNFVTPNLTFLKITCCKCLTSLPKGMSQLMPSLKELQLWDCPQLKSIPDVCLLTNLRLVSINNSNEQLCRELKQNLPNLTNLTCIIWDRRTASNSLRSRSRDWTPYHQDPEQRSIASN